MIKNKDIILMRINSIERELNELRSLLEYADGKPHNCYDNLEPIMFNVNTNHTGSNYIRHKCKICGEEKTPLNNCFTYGGDDSINIGIPSHHPISQGHDSTKMGISSTAFPTTSAGNIVIGTNNNNNNNLN